MAMARGLVFLGKKVTVLFGQSRLCTLSASSWTGAFEGRMSLMFERRKPIWTVAVDTIEEPRRRGASSGTKMAGGARRLSARFARFVDIDAFLADVGE